MILWAGVAKVKAQAAQAAVDALETQAALLGVR